MSSSPHILIVEAPYYKDLTDELVRGAVLEIEKRGATYERVSVPGVLEIPAGVRYAHGKYDGFVAIGCVIRGETTHYEIVSNESARALMDMTVNQQIALGNGIQTVENRDQAWVRANVDDKNKGGAAATAALDMIALKQKFGVSLR